MFEEKPTAHASGLQTYQRSSYFQDLFSAGTVANVQVSPWTPIPSHTHTQPPWQGNSMQKTGCVLWMWLTWLQFSDSWDIKGGIALTGFSCTSLDITIKDGREYVVWNGRQEELPIFTWKGINHYQVSSPHCSAKSWHCSKQVMEAYTCGGRTGHHLQRPTDHRIEWSLISPPNQDDKGSEKRDWPTRPRQCLT